MTIAISLGIGPSITTPTYWSPLALGASLLAWWDSSSGVSLSADKVTAWVDKIGGYSAAQGTDDLRPTYSATSFNGSPGITFDGSNDALIVATQPASFPINADPCEMWAVAQQDGLVADTNSRFLFQYGGSGGLTRRDIRRAVSSGVNRMQAFVGNGAASISATNTTVDLSSRHVLRGKMTATAVGISVDGSALTSNAVVPATGTQRASIGASTTSTFTWNGKIRDIIVTGALTDAQAASLQAFLLGRRNL